MQFGNCATARWSGLRALLLVGKRKKSEKDNDMDMDMGMDMDMDTDMGMDMDMGFGMDMDSYTHWDLPWDETMRAGNYGCT